MMFRKTLLTAGLTLALAAPALADTYTIDGLTPKPPSRCGTS